jgi:LuxR family transcriptional regulator, maltose regulon positive regulatory protein
MFNSLLATKLFIPQARADLVRRPRLIRRLDQGMRAPVVLISAPAGSGKTTLLSEWFAGRRTYQLVWLSLEADDNDPARFMIYLAAAVDPLKPGIGENAIILLQSPQAWKTVMTALINSLSSIEEDFAVVMEDYHNIADPTIHEAITFLIDHLPQHMHLIFTTRADPPLPLARLRARGSITEIHGDDLRFTPEETGLFLHKLLDHEFTDTEIAALTKRTDGWIAGIRLAALAMRGHDNIPAFITAFTTSKRYIMDYLVEEVLSREPDHIRQFLLYTSLLDQLEESICFAVVGTNEKYFEGILEWLAHHHLFIEPLDNRREWYRYHALFAEALRQHLQRVQPEKIKELHYRASRWYEYTGFNDDAIQHALLAQDFNRAAALIQRVARNLIAVSELTTLRRWLEALPDDVIRVKPGLSIAYAWILGLNNQIDAGEKHLQNALQILETHESISPKERDRLLAEAKTLQASAALSRHDFDRSIILSQQALQHSDEMRSMNTYNMGTAYQMIGRDAEAMQAFTDTVQQARTEGNLTLVVFALAKLAALQQLRGQLRAALHTAQQLVRLASTRDNHPLPLAASGYLVLGGLSYEWNQLDTAEQCFRQAVSLCLENESANLLVEGYLALSRVRQARGDMAGAHAMIHDARHAVEAAHHTPGRVRVGAYETRLWLAQGEINRAAYWMMESGLRPDGNLAENLDAEYLTLARLLIARGTLTDARYLLDRLLTAAETAGRVGRIIEIRMLQSLARHAQGETESALTFLERALSLAQSEGYTRLFLDEGAPLRELLAQVKGTLVKDYAARLLA